MADGAALDQPPRRLHPLSMVRGIGPRQLFSAYAPLAFVVTGEELPRVLVIGLAALITVVLAVIRIVTWQRRTYAFADGRIVERSGVISRSERALEIARIQQVDVERTLLDRVVGTCELRLETAADSGDAELALRVVSVEEATRLRQLLAAAGVDAAADDLATEAPAPDPGAVPAGGAPPTSDDLEPGLFVPEEPQHVRRREEVLVRVPLAHVALAAVTGRRLLTVPLALAALLGFLAENGGFEDRVDEVGAQVLAAGVTAVLVVALVLLVLVPVTAVVTGVLRDGGFTIARRGDDLQVRRGLTTTRSATVPLRRVQRVRVDRSWIRARLGYATVTLFSAGGGGGEGGGGPAESLDRALTVPLLPEADVAPLVAQLLGIEDTPPVEPHPPVVRRRMVVKSLLAMLPVLALATVPIQLFERPDWSWLAPLAVALAVYAVWIGRRRYRWLATGVDEHVVAGRHGAIGSTTELTPLRKTQGTDVTSTPFQRRVGLASVHVRVAGPAGGVELPDLDADHARALAPTLLR